MSEPSYLLRRSAFSVPAYMPIRKSKNVSSPPFIKHNDALIKYIFFDVGSTILKQSSVLNVMCDIVPAFNI